MSDEIPNQSSLVGQATTAARYLAMWGTGYAVGAGWIAQDTADMVVTVIASATPMLIGMALTRLHRRKVIEAKREIVALKSQADSGQSSSPD